MFRYRSERNTEGVGNVCDGHIILKKHRQNGAPRRIGERGKNRVELCGGRLGHGCLDVLDARVGAVLMR